jgi:cysteine synthase B
MNASSKRGQALLNAVGNTPLIELNMFSEQLGTNRLFAKLETVNPGGSLKDRPVKRMITKAIEEGKLEGGKRILDSSSGNAGIAYAQFGAALGVPITLIVPENASRERLDRIRAHGAELILTDAMKGYDFTLLEAKRLAREFPDKYFYSNQYSNENNWMAHYETTGVEILDQLKNDYAIDCPDVFVAGVGTGGTITGVGKRLKETRSDVHITSVIPDIFPGIEGLKPLGTEGDIVPEILDESLIDERITVTIETCIEYCQKLAEHGLFVGPSSGAFVSTALKMAEGRENKTIVTILNDTGERYGSTGMWQLPS